MTPRTIQIGASFAIVLVVYSAYALLAVPLIETQIKITGVADNGGGPDLKITSTPELESRGALSRQRLGTRTRKHPFQQ